LQPTLRELLRDLTGQTKAINKGISSIEKVFKEKGYLDKRETEALSRAKRASKRMEVLRARENAVYKFDSSETSPSRSRSRRSLAKSYPPVIGGDADIEVVRVESFGHRPQKAPSRATRRSQHDTDTVPVREDRPWETKELKDLFSQLAEVKRAGNLNLPFFLPPLPTPTTSALTRWNRPWRELQP
jgi:hypothetical protein